MRVAADDERHAPELRALELLHGGEKGVQIQMGDDRRHSRIVTRATGRGKEEGVARRTVISQLASAGEEALGQLVQNPVTRKALEGALQVKDRVEKLVTGLAAIDGRVSRLEKRVAALEKPKSSAAQKSTTAKRSAAAKRRASNS